MRSHSEELGSDPPASQEILLQKEAAHTALLAGLFRFSVGVLAWHRIVIQPSSRG